MTNNTLWLYFQFQFSHAGLYFYCTILMHVWKPTSALFLVSNSVGLQPPTASDLRQRRTSTSDSIGPQPPTASDLRQRRTSTSDSIGPPTASDFISDSVGVLSPTAADFYLQQRRTSISDSVGLLSPTASDFISDSVGQDYNLRQRRTSISNS